MVSQSTIRNDPRLQDLKILTVSGERGEESKARSKYKIYEADTKLSTKNRVVDRYRPCKNWLEPQVWAIIRKYKVRVHPAYYLGFGRLSCAPCIFANANQLASLRKVNPTQFDQVAAYESDFGITIDRGRIYYPEKADSGTPYPDMKQSDIDDSVNTSFNHSIEIDPWILPAGAYGENDGPS